MSIRESELARLVPELAAALVGRPLRGAWQPARDQVVLGFADGTYLLLVPRGPDARLHTVPARPPNPQHPFSFQGALRAHLQGPLLALEQIPDERAVEMRFRGATIHLRLTGRSGGLWLLRDGRVTAAYDGPAPPALPPFAPRGPERAPPRMVPDPTWDEAIRRFYEQRIHARRLHELRIRVERGLRRRRSKLLRLLTHLEDDLARADDADRVRMLADTLAVHLHAVRGGPTEVVLPDPVTGAPVTVPLRPGEAPHRSLDALYRRARKLERMGEQVLARMERAERELEAVEAQLERVDTLDEARLEQLLASDRGGPGRRALPRGIMAWTGPRGERVLAGKDAKANRILTFQLGRGHDVWMHLRDRPGAHLLLPMERGHTPTLPHLLAAGQIALLLAHIPEGAKADVRYTQVRNLRSIPGSPNAAVRVWNEKVLHLTRDDAPLVGWERER